MASIRIPYCVLLLDEIEKAHPDLFNILLQVMDHGKLTDHNGKSIDFRNVILVMTTNAGAADLAKAAFGFTRSKREGDDSEAINKMFTPEFRNRLDAIIPFGHLPPEVVRMVVQKFVLQLEAQLDERQINIELSDERPTGWRVKGYDEQMGARPLARVIQKYVKQPLADEVLFGKLKAGGTVRVLLGKDAQGLEELQFKFLSRNEEKALPKPEKRKALPSNKKPRRRRKPRALLPPRRRPRRSQAGARARRKASSSGGFLRNHVTGAGQAMSGSFRFVKGRLLHGHHAAGGLARRGACAVPSDA
jgi:ATP-dependent Clp protease ATP-binding subunit ClpA